MGDFTLGCLLGQYDKAQSFDVASAAAGFANVNSWLISPGSGAFSAGVEVHSSVQGLLASVGSWGAVHVWFSYDHRFADDAYGRWSPEVTTHAIRTDFRARLFGDAASGGTVVDYIGVGSLYVPRAPTLQVLRTSYSSVTSGTGGGGAIFRFKRGGSLTTSAGLYVDDVLTQIDPITLNPTWDYQEAAQVLAAQNRTLGGNLATYQWAKHFEYSVPLQYIPTSYADLLNWWWENRFNLALTLNTSDTESIRVVRLVNDRQPIGKRMQPYADQWQGLLQLESIDKGSLVF